MATLSADCGKRNLLGGRDMRLLARSTLVALITGLLLLSMTVTASAIGPGDANSTGEANANSNTPGEDTHPGNAERCTATLAALSSDAFGSLDPALQQAFLEFYVEECVL